MSVCYHSLGFLQISGIDGFAMRRSLGTLQSVDLGDEFQMIGFLDTYQIINRLRTSPVGKPNPQNASGTFALWSYILCLPIRP